MMALGHRIDAHLDIADRRVNQPTRRQLDSSERDRRTASGPQDTVETVEQPRDVAVVVVPDEPDGGLARERSLGAVTKAVGDGDQKTVAPLDEGGGIAIHGQAGDGTGPDAVKEKAANRATFAPR